MQSSILLKVPYYSQRDNRNQPWRTCNTSTHAMLLNALKPGSVKSDDEYWEKFVEPCGDSTDHNVHTKALARFGIESYWSTQLDFKHLDKSLAAKIPVAIGVLHRGFIASPTGGHIILVIGAEYRSPVTRNDDVFICHDPWGKGFNEYSDPNGEAVKYPVMPSLKARWAPEPFSGWGRVVTAIDGKPTGL